MTSSAIRYAENSASDMIADAEEQAGVGSPAEVGNYMRLLSRT